jgi:5-methylcytosine-specific restriction endonuclease McrA
MPPGRTGPDEARLNRLVAEARRNRERREKTYREQALRIHPWICTRCAREFTRANAHQLTVHHKDGNHDHNPPDGSNWELLCVYCHDNEHSRYLEHVAQGAPAPGGPPEAPATHRPFADLEARLKRRSKPDDGP